MVEISNIDRANKVAARYFCSCLKRSPKAQRYISSRVSGNTARLFRLGYVPNTGVWDALCAKGIKVKVLNSLGIFKDKECIFRNRIVFPVVHNSRLVGFGARALDDNYLPKYINSRSTILYDKKSILYVSDIAKKYIHNRGWVLLVEGYFDVLSLYDIGIKNAVATCGTAFTDYHARYIKRWANKVVICYDGDFAGVHATKKAVGVLRENRMAMCKVPLPEDCDPDDYIKKNGRKKFIKLIKGAMKKNGILGIRKG